MQIEYAPFCRQIFLKNAKTIFSERQGIYLRARNGAQSEWAYGEAAPLEGFSRESVSDCLVEISDPAKRELIVESISMGTGGDRLLPSIQFAAESIYFNTQKQENNNELKLSYLVGGFPDLGIQRQAGVTAISRGFLNLKIKIALSSLPGIDDLLSQLSEAGRNKVLFRLDANESLTPGILAEIPKKLSLQNLARIEYIEDPYSGFKVDQHKIPLAIDKGLELEDFSDTRFTLIVKPMVQFGLTQLQKILSGAHASKAKIVLSSSLETEVGLLALRNFARTFANQEIAHGLATAGILDDPQIDDRPIIQKLEVLSVKNLSALNTLDWRAI